MPLWKEQKLRSGRCKKTKNSVCGDRSFFSALAEKLVYEVPKSTL